MAIKKKISKKTLKRYSSSLIAVAKRQRKRGDKYLNDPEGNEKDNKDMKRMFYGDAKDFETVARHIKNGVFWRAYNKLCDMDTAARDECPCYIFDFLERKAR